MTFYATIVLILLPPLPDAIVGNNFGIPTDGHTILVCNRTNGSYLPTAMLKDLARPV